MITDVEGLPTTFAVTLGNESGILVELDAGKNHHEFRKRTDAMRCFQQMSLATSFENSMVAFHGMKLNKKQNEILRIIYDSTKSWVKGHAIGCLMRDMSDIDSKSADRVAASLTILSEVVDGVDLESAGGGGRSNKKGLVLVHSKKKAEANGK